MCSSDLITLNDKVWIPYSDSFVSGSDQTFVDSAAQLTETEILQVEGNIETSYLLPRKHQPLTFCSTHRGVSWDCLILVNGKLVPLSESCGLKSTSVENTSSDSQMSWNERRQHYGRSASAAHWVHPGLIIARDSLERCDLSF